MGKTLEQLRRDAAILVSQNKGVFLLPSVKLPPISQPTNSIFDPRNLDDYIGQPKAKEICRIIVDAANKEDRAIPNVLIVGPYGLGKTTLAKLIFWRHDKPFRLLDGGIAGKIDEFHDYLLIDEIHNMPDETCDRLNTLMDQGLVHIVGCTNNPGALPVAFRSRFRQIDLEDYTIENIDTIIKNVLKRKEMPADKNATLRIADRSRLNPRNALQILAFTLELTTLADHVKLTTQTVNSALRKLDIDEDGLRLIDRKYLEQLSSVAPTGLTQICAALGTDSETVEYEIEPYLIKKGKIQRTQRGRILVEQITDEQLLSMLQQSVDIRKKKERLEY